MTDDDPETWLAAIRQRLAERLSAMHGTWRDDGTLVVGPGTLSVRPGLVHEALSGHVDIAFELNRSRQDAPVIWDCVSGAGHDIEMRAEFACNVWVQTTARAVLELVTSCGEFADHSHSDPKLGLPGWHSIHGPVLAYGGDGRAVLQTWCLENPVVPLLGAQLADVLSAMPGAVHGVKFLLGAFGPKSIAEVRIDGVCHDGCTEAVLAMPWPKTASSVARFFVLFVHELEAR
jgi:hypothetical protein